MTPREVWLDLLHREAEGDLTAAERAQVAALWGDVEVAQVRTSLAAVTASLSALPPPVLPRPLAEEVASEVAWAARLQAMPSPVLPRSLASPLASDIRLCQQLVRGTPPLPRSVARTVASEVRIAGLLAAPPLARPAVAPGVAAEVAWAARLRGAPPPLPLPLAGRVAARIVREAGGGPGTVTGRAAPQRANSAPLLLVAGLLTGLTLLGITSAWPNLAAGATVLQALITQVSPLAGLGLLLLLAASLLITWRPTPGVQRLGAAALALSGVLTLPPLYQAVARSGITVGHNVTVHGAVPGNVIAVGGNVVLAADARVRGEVITLFGDVRRVPGARVTGRVSTLLGHAPGDATALQTAPPAGLNLATASAFRPLLGWLGGAAWGQVFLVLTGGMLLLLFVTGTAPLLARRQRHAPLRTLALGILALALLTGPALGLALVGLLVPALLASAFALLLIATGLSVSAYDAGRALAYRLRSPAPDAAGAALGLIAVALSLGLPPLALVVALVGGAWGTGTLLLTRADGEQQRAGPREGPAHRD